MSDEIEQIYDRLVAAEKLKDGTKFERLTALTFQILDRSALVIQDVTLRGPGKEAEHQIDVTVEGSSGKPRRVIVEARDRKDPVDLDQVRSFFGVIHQLEPDMAWVVSVTGFTEDATKYACDEGIGLAELRPATPSDDNRVKEIHFKLSVQAMGTPTITRWLAADEAERTRLKGLLQDKEGAIQQVNTEDAYFYDERGQPEATLREVLEPIFQSLELELGENEGRHEFDRIYRLDLAGVRAAIKGFTYCVALTESSHEFSVGNAASVAELVFRSVDGTAPDPIDRVIYDSDLQGLTLDDEGRIRPRAN